MSPSIRLFLARHGRTQWNLEQRFQGCTDIALDDLGRAQASSLANVLRGRIEAVVASDLARASESARIVAGALQLPLLALDSDLRERGYGVFEGLNRGECIARYPAAWEARGQNAHFQPPGGESHEAVIARMQRGLARVVDRARGHYENVLVVGHGSSLRMFLEVVSGRPEPTFSNMEFREVLCDGETFALAAGSRA